MKKAKSGSVAPKERINIVYKPNDAGARDKVELPMRMMVLGDFSKKEDGSPLADRELLSVNNQNFNSIMKKVGVDINIKVENKITGNPDDYLDVDLEFADIKDFSPDEIVKKIPELNKLLELRESLVALKGPMGNLPNLRRAIQNKVEDESEKAKLVQELRIEDKSSKSDSE